jgi:hypothetical protein
MIDGVHERVRETYKIAIGSKLKFGDTMEPYPGVIGAR